MQEGCYKNRMRQKRNQMHKRSQMPKAEYIITMSNILFVCTLKVAKHFFPLKNTQKSSGFVQNVLLKWSPVPWLLLYLSIVFLLLHFHDLIYHIATKFNVIAYDNPHEFVSKYLATTKTNRTMVQNIKSKNQ